VLYDSFWYDETLIFSTYNRMVHRMAKRLKQNDARQANLVAASTNDAADDTLVESLLESERPSDGNFPMVGIVASAGGLDALKHFFAAMPSECGMAFVLVPHLDAKHKSLMVELLARQTTMPVAEAIEGMRVEINSVYIIQAMEHWGFARSNVVVEWSWRKVQNQLNLSRCLAAL